MQPDVLAADRDLFRDSVEDHLANDIFTIRQWVLSHRQIIHCSRREAKHCSTHNIKLLPKYFHPLKAGKQKQKYYISLPTPVLVYKSTPMADHFPHTPYIPNPVIRSDQQLAHLIRNFQQPPLIFGGDHPTQFRTSDITLLSWWVCILAYGGKEVALITQLSFNHLIRI
jgi:hypothetical protein